MSSDDSSPVYLGFDLSSQSLKCIAITSSLKALHEESINFDADLPHYSVTSGVHKNPTTHEVYAPVAMWIEALDLLLSRMHSSGSFSFSRIAGISGAGQQHGSVYWSSSASSLLQNLDPKKSLVEQLKDEAFTHPWSPNWQDHSTQAQCEKFEAKVGGEEALARITGSKAHHRFTGPQICRFRELREQVYGETERISLVSSFLASLWLGDIAPLDIADVCGMNLWDIQKGGWSEKLLEEAAGGAEAVEELRRKLGEPEEVHGKRLGSVSKYYVEKYGFNPDCAIYPFTGDNPSTILALPLRPLDVIISLGTSTTLLMATPTYHPSPEYHLFNHPTTKNLYMFMLCYCNGALARESIRDSLNPSPPKSWDSFNTAAASATSSPDLTSDDAKIGLYFPIPEIIPAVDAGTWRFNYNIPSKTLTPATWAPKDDVPAILASQALSMRLRSSPLLASNNGQPRRLYFVGGASRNREITRAMADVIGGTEGVYELDIGGNACALGAAYYAVWAKERGERNGEMEGFEDFVAGRWEEEKRVKKVGEAYREGVWERFREVLGGFVEAEKRAVKEKGTEN